MAPTAKAVFGASGRRRGTQGQAVLEFALTLPLLLFLLAWIVDFGGLLYAYITVASAARDGLQYAVLAGATADAPTPATGTQILNLVTGDLSSLPNNANALVAVCENNDGNVTQLAGSGTCANVATDPEATNPGAGVGGQVPYVLMSVAVQYTYTPLFGRMTPVYMMRFQRGLFVVNRHVFMRVMQ